MDDLEADIRKHLQKVVGLVADILGPDLLDPDDAEDRVIDRACEYAAQLRDPDPDVAHRAATLLRDLVDPDTPEGAATCLGIALAFTPRYEADLLTQAEAARLMGVSRQRVWDLLKLERLERVDKQVTRTSVARELARGYTMHVVERIDRDGRGLGAYLSNLGTWEPAAKARRFATLKDARRVATRGPTGTYARGITVQCDGYVL